MTTRRVLSSALAAHILHSIAGAACAGVVIHASGCGTDSDEGDGGPGASSVVVSGGGTPKEGIQCIPWPPQGEGGAGGSGGAASSTVASTGGAGSCPSPEYVTTMPDSQSPYLSVSEFCGYAGCCSSYQTVGDGTPQDGTCCYEVLANCAGASGRPLVVDGRALTASATRGAAGAWGAAARPSVDGLSAAQRQALTSAWLGDALLEHASVASFSRFAIELMAVGAPAELLDGAHAAARDEVKHARLCFALASAYAGQALEPAAMPSLRGLAMSADLVDVAGRAVVEGCVGETLAALQAAEQLEGASDAAVRDVLLQIAEDEAKHAALAWRFVAWALRSGDDAVRDAVTRSFEDAIAALEVTSAGAHHARDEALERHGRLGAAATHAVARAAIASAIRPGMRALLARAAGADEGITRARA